MIGEGVVYHSHRPFYGARPGAGGACPAAEFIVKRTSAVRLIFTGVVAALFWVVLSQAPAGALEQPGSELKEVGITFRQGDRVNLDLPFTDSSGTTVRLRELFESGKPVVLTPVYYDCPRLCGLLLSGALTAFNGLEFLPGRDYKILTVSMDPAEGPELAAKRAQEYRAQFKEPEAASQGWHFLTGEAAPVRELFDSVGFRYLPDGGEFAHTAALILLTPQGEISQYFTGIEFPLRDFRLALIDASKGNIGSLVDHVFLFCFRFDQTQGRYTWAAFNLMRVGGLLSFLGIVYLIYRLARGKGPGGRTSAEGAQVSSSS